MEIGAATVRAGLIPGEYVAITTEDDPTPLVLILANTVRRSAAANPGQLAKLRGVAAVRSVKDPQAVTLRFDKGDVHLEHGVAADVGVTIGLDFDLDGLPEAPAPKVTGAARHPLFALGLAKVLEPPMPTLEEAATEFWAAAHAMHGMPSGLLVRATDADASVTLGDETTERFELLGPTDRLVRILTGQSPALVEVQEGRCHVRGSLAAAAALTRATVHVALAEPTPGGTTDG